MCVHSSLKISPSKYLALEMTNFLDGIFKSLKKIHLFFLGLINFSIDFLKLLFSSFFILLKLFSKKISKKLKQKVGINTCLIILSLVITVYNGDVTEP